MTEELKELTTTVEAPLGDSQVGILDESGYEILTKQQEALLGELEMFEKNVEQLKAQKENYSVQWNTENEIWQLKLNNFHRIAPQFTYEEIPRYWELQKEMLGYQYREVKHQAEARLKTFDVRMETAEREIVSIREALEKNKASLAQLEKEMGGQE